MEWKSRYPDAILFFRLGDFYEMFFEDAKTASSILGITLTSRGTLDGERVPMCGVPYHASRNYIARLIGSGQKVAICEQVEEPGASRGIVKREVVRIVTPGSAVEEANLDDGRSLFTASLCSRDGTVGLAYADISTGDLRITQLNSLKDAAAELARIAPAEVLIPQNEGIFSAMESPLYRIERADREWFVLEKAEDLLKAHFGVASLAGFGCDEMPEGVRAAGALMAYIQETQRRLPHHIKDLIAYRIADYLFMDGSTVQNLELIAPLRGQSPKGTLYHVLDHTLTPMGARLLRTWILYPLVNPKPIRERLEAVSFLMNSPLILEEVRGTLSGMGDMERLNGKVALGRATPRDLTALKVALEKACLLREKLKEAQSALLSNLSGALGDFSELVRIIDAAIKDDPPANLKEGGIIREGYDPELDRLIRLSRDGKSWMAEFEASEQARTGIPRLKVGYNKVYGYYIEVSKANAHLVPADYIRKQTLVNGERYINEALKGMEEQVVEAEERRLELEKEIFGRLVALAAEESGRIRDTASAVAAIDVLGALARAAHKHNYTCPEVNEDDRISISDGRHPFVELTARGEDFVPNDIELDSTSLQVLIITGPNMAGKSTILRQTALAVIMAQMGSFVPASRAAIGIIDRIFTRVGASDDLARGRSTFMVEMSETANILRNATNRSLVILDEIGRGTSTYDGLSIAWAVAEALHDLNGKGVKTLFATHYHELTELASSKPRVKNFHVVVREWNDRIVFLRKMMPGATSRSYGIQCARIAGIPEAVIMRAKEVLESLEGSSLKRRLAGRAEVKGQKTKMFLPEQMPLFSDPGEELKNLLLSIDVDKMTPLDALVELNRLKGLARSGL
jgi:DNA mismatch repair protein MutS